MNNRFCLGVAYDLKRGQAKALGEAFPSIERATGDSVSNKCLHQSCAKLCGHRFLGLRAHDINTTGVRFHRMNNIVDLFDFLVRKAQKRYRKLIKSEAKGKRKKARKHERKLLALNLKIGFFKRQRKSSNRNQVGWMARF
jgi:hypothetical protein